MPVVSLNWVLTAGSSEEEARAPRVASLSINNVFGMLRAAESGLGLASLPDYLGFSSSALQRVLDHAEGPSFTAYFVYPEELKTSKRVVGVPRLPAGEGGRAARLVRRHGSRAKFAWLICARLWPDLASAPRQPAFD